MDIQSKFEHVLRLIKDNPLSGDEDEIVEFLETLQTDVEDKITSLESEASEARGELEALEDGGPIGEKMYAFQIGGLDHVEIYMENGNLAVRSLIESFFEKLTNKYVPGTFKPQLAFR